MNKIYKFILISLFAGFFFSSPKVRAETTNSGYRVSSSEKTLIQIARDVYNDERLWKKISHWNNITPPYALKIGQILVLPYAPVNQIPSENSVAAPETPTPVFSHKLPSVEQQLNDHNGEYTYVVNERAPSLSMVAIENYGNKKMATVIAKWNGLSPQAKLSLSQHLKLKLRPRFNAAEARTALIKQWAKMGNPEMVARLGNKKIPVNSVFQKVPTANLPPAPVVFDPDSKREPAAVPPAQLRAEPPADLSSDSSWYGEKSSNAIESLLRAISY